MSLLPAEAVKIISESIGIGAVSDDVAFSLAQDIEYRLRDIIQESLKFMRHGKRTRLSTEDINNALKVRNVERLYGFSTSAPVHFKNLTYAQNAYIFYLDDDELDFDDIINAPMPKVPAEITFTSHWLAVEGVQPAIPQNPAPIETRIELLSKKLRSEGRFDLNEKKTEVKPLIRHVLTKELQLFFEKIAEALLSKSSELRETAIQSIAEDHGIQQLLPYFIQFVTEQITKDIKNHLLLQTMLRVLDACITNPHFFIEPYLHQFMPPILSCLVAKNICNDPAEDHWSTRLFASRLLCHICTKYGKSYETLVPRVTRTLLRAFLDPLKSFSTHFGAIIGLSALGASVVKAVVIPNIKPYIELVKPYLEDDSNPVKKFEAQKCFDALKATSASYVIAETAKDITSNVSFEQEDAGMMQVDFADVSSVEHFQQLEHVKMANIVLILTSAIFAVLVLIAAIYFLVYFQHPDDKWVAWGPKVVVVLGIALCCFNVLLLPLDVANQGGQLQAVGGIPMESLTVGLFIATIAMALAVVPFMMFYYEGMDEREENDNNITKQVFYAVKWCAITLVIFFLGDSLLWYYEGYADIPVDELTSPLLNSTSAVFDFCSSSTSSIPCTERLNVVETIEVSYTVYMIAIASFAGWILFAVFGGIGLSALPFDLLLSFKHRPRRIKLQEYTDKKKIIGEQAALLLQASGTIADDVKKNRKDGGFMSRNGRKIKKKENEFKRDVLFLEEEWEKLEDSYKNGGGNPLKQFSLLIVGIIGSVVSLFWLLHILLYVLPVTANQLPVSPFLNSFFENTFPVPIFGIVFYGIFTFWLLLCVMKGTLKMGIRFLFITIHPVKMGQTMMSSLVFNVGLMLFASMAVTQFCTVAFAEYAKFTAAVAIFGNQLQTLRGIKYVYSVLIYVLPSMSFISILYIGIRPYDGRRKPIV